MENSCKRCQPCILSNTHLASHSNLLSMSLTTWAWRSQNVPQAHEWHRHRYLWLAHFSISAREEEWMSATPRPQSVDCSELPRCVSTWVSLFVGKSADEPKQRSIEIETVPWYQSDHWDIQRVGLLLRTAPLRSAHVRSRKIPSDGRKRSPNVADICVWPHIQLRTAFSSVVAEYRDVLHRVSLHLKDQ